MIYRVINPNADPQEAYILACQAVLPAGMLGLKILFPVGFLAIHFFNFGCAMTPAIILFTHWLNLDESLEIS